MKRIRTLTLLLFLLLLISGCKKEETPYTRNIVLEGSHSLPVYESSLTYNAEPPEEIRAKLFAIFNKENSTFNFDKDYIIVDHNGKNLTEELTEKEPENFSEMQELVMKIKENAYQIVDSENYRVTTLEKEMKALYQGKRRLFPGDSLRKILEDNKEAYRDEDYGAINVYLIQNKITVYMPLEP